MNNIKTIILGGGCFWCIEAVFQDMPGVEKVTSGYAGGETSNPSYEEVSSGDTGHAEVVKIDFDSDKISLEKILEIFFTAHNPTTLNRQGNDVGTQYRSMILFTEDEQEKIIKDFITNLQKDYDEKIVTEVKNIDKFYEAEEYHQNYFRKNPDQAYCQVVIKPKLKKVEEKFNN